MSEYPLRVELPHGQHAMVRDPELVPERRRRPYLDAVEKGTGAMLESGDITAAELQAAQQAVDDDSDDEAAKAAKSEMQVKVGLAALRGGARGLQRAARDLLLAALVESWSYEWPVSADSVLDLPGGAYDALVEVCEALAPQMSPDFSPNPDPQSPTSPSNA